MLMLYCGQSRRIFMIGSLPLDIRIRSIRHLKHAPSAVDPTGRFAAVESCCTTAMACMRTLSYGMHVARSQPHCRPIHRGVMQAVRPRARRATIKRARSTRLDTASTRSANRAATTPLCSRRQRGTLGVANRPPTTTPATARKLCCCWGWCWPRWPPPPRRARAAVAGAAAASRRFQSRGPDATGSTSHRRASATAR